MPDANEHQMDPAILAALETGAVVEIDLDADLDDDAIAAIIDALEAAAHSRGLQQAAEIITYDDDEPQRTRRHQNTRSDSSKPDEPQRLKLTGEQFS